LVIYFPSFSSDFYYLLIDCAKIHYYYQSSLYKSFHERQKSDVVSSSLRANARLQVNSILCPKIFLTTLLKIFLRCTKVFFKGQTSLYIASFALELLCFLRMALHNFDVHEMTFTNVIGDSLSKQKKYVVPNSVLKWLTIQNV